MAITTKGRAFIEHYLKCFNATQSARVAGYAYPNKQGPRLLVNVGIRTEIQRRLDEKCMGADEVLTRLAEQARSDVSEFITDHGAIDWEAVKRHGHLVKKVRSKDGDSSIELHDAQSALVLIGKHHGLFVERVRHEAEVELTSADFARAAEELEEWREARSGSSAASTPSTS